MALVDYYSDSESDSEAPAGATTVPKSASTSKAAFQRSSIAAGKMAVALPTLKPESGQNGPVGADGPPAKRARTGGAFSGFNSLLPAPKRVAAPKAGVSLKTSSEAAFSRHPVPRPVADDAPEDEDIAATTTSADNSEAPPPPEPKLVGKATRFLPLSVSNKNKKKPISKPPPVQERSNSTDNGKHSDMAKAVTDKVAVEAEAAPTPKPKPKPKRSLFSVQQEDEAQPIQSESPYEPLTSQEGRAYLPEEVQQPVQHVAPAHPNSLEAVADDMNLTPAQRRQLFGRDGRAANVTHFNMDSEYAHNEELRQAGQVVEHRAVKAIAPGKHSLQQLVNNARSQKDALDDKFAEGKANRSAGGAKYGWSQ